MPFLLTELYSEESYGTDYLCLEVAMNRLRLNSPAQNGRILHAAYLPQAYLLNSPLSNTHAHTHTNMRELSLSQQAEQLCFVSTLECTIEKAFYHKSLPAILTSNQIQSDYPRPHLCTVTHTFIVKENYLELFLLYYYTICCMSQHCKEETK